MLFSWWYDSIRCVLNGHYYEVAKRCRIAEKDRVVSRQSRCWKGVGSFFAIYIGKRSYIILVLQAAEIAKLFVR